MLNFAEIMRNAQGGAAIESFAAQFGMSQEDTRKALAALAPAFAIGLQQQREKPDHLRDLTEAMARGAYAPFFESAAEAYSQDARRRGEEALGALFGSPDLARNLSDQSAKLAGLSRETMSQMMPYVAATLMGGMGERMRSQSDARRDRASDNPYETMFSAMFGVEPEPAPPPRSEGEKAVAEMFGHWERFMQLGREMQDTQMQMMRTVFEDAARQMAHAAPQPGTPDQPRPPKDEV